MMAGVVTLFSNEDNKASQKEESPAPQPLVDHSNEDNNRFRIERITPNPQSIADHLRFKIIDTEYKHDEPRGVKAEPFKLTEQDLKQAESLLKD